MKQNGRYTTESLFSGVNTPFLNDLLHRYKENPNSLDKSWRDFLNEFSCDLADTEVNFPKIDRTDLKNKSKPHTSQETLKSMRALMLIRAFRVLGHLVSNLDPLNIEKKTVPIELDPKRYGFEETDLDTEIFLDNVLGLESSSLRVILDKLKNIYCGNIGFEFMHIQNAEQKAWLQMRIENGLEKSSNHDKKETLIQLLRAEFFERFLHVKYPGAKRFSIEGAEGVLVALETLLNRLATNYSVEELIFGMSHRGRLAVLTNFMDQPMRYLFAQFRGKNIYSEQYEHLSGDVKYHQGYSSDRIVGKKQVHLVLLANPSHLEAVCPVTLGKIRARQFLEKDTKREKIVGLLLHGDAAFAGQGLIAETLELSALE